MQYEQIWDAIDKLAKQNGLSLSGLAKKSGLDPTIFNKSKRLRHDGKKRWPSLESLNKILTVYSVHPAGSEDKRLRTVPANFIFTG